MKADKLLYMKRELQGKSPKELAELWQGLGYDFPPHPSGTLDGDASRVDRRRPNKRGTKLAPFF